MTDDKVRQFARDARTRLELLSGGTYDVSMPIGMDRQGEIIYTSPGQLIADDLRTALNILDRFLGATNDG